MTRQWIEPLGLIEGPAALCGARRAGPAAAGRPCRLPAGPADRGRRRSRPPSGAGDPRGWQPAAGADPPPAAFAGIEPARPAGRWSWASSTSRPTASPMPASPPTPPPPSPVAMRCWRPGPTSSTSAARAPGRAPRRSRRRRRSAASCRWSRDLARAAPVSIDTRHAATMAAALEAGAEIVNDVTALRHDGAALRVVDRGGRAGGADAHAGHRAAHHAGRGPLRRRGAGGRAVPRATGSRRWSGAASARPASPSIPASASARPWRTTSRCCNACRCWPGSAARSWSALSRKRFIGRIAGMPSRRAARCAELAAAACAAARGAADPARA